MKVENKDRNWLSRSFWGFITVLIVQWIWPWVIPFHTFAFWHMRGSVGTWLAASLPLMMWGFFIKTFFEIVITRSQSNDVFLEQMFEVLTRSTFAGVVEEICFRWVLFLDSIIVVKITNFLFFGFLGFGIPRWFHLELAGPLADWTTLHGLHRYLFAPESWAVGAAMLGANAFFREGHGYQGLFGLINSWFIGMFLFWIMFTYGLPAAILLHVLYDVLVMTIGVIGDRVRSS